MEEKQNDSNSNTNNDNQLDKYLSCTIHEELPLYYVPDICNLGKGKECENDKVENYKINYDENGSIKNISDEKLAELDYLFILESPHTDEVAKGYPLAGDSGKAISQYLFGDETPFGKLVSSINTKIAIINVSNVPLNVNKQIWDNANFDTENWGKAKSAILNDSKELASQLEYIRNGKLDTKNSKCEETLLKQFYKKLENFINIKNLTIIACGEFAKVYLDEFIEEYKKTHGHGIFPKVLYVPHPSRGHWQFIDKHQQNLHELKDKFTPNNDNKK